MKTDYKQFSINLAKKAGKIIKANFNLGMKKEWKKDNTPLTKTDLAINQLVLDSVKKDFPKHSVLAEEGDNFKKSDEFVWVCDPLDGTIPFSHGVPTCVFSLALTKNGEPIVGTIYDPFMDRLFFAAKDESATMNGEKISVSKNDAFENSVIGICYWTRAQFNFSALFGALKKEDAKTMDVVSITYMGALVANGEFAATIFPGNKPHDTAALKIIVEEAGGKATDIFGHEQRYDREIKGHIVSNGKLHNQLVKLVEENVGQ